MAVGVLDGLLDGDRVGIADVGLDEGCTDGVVGEDVGGTEQDCDPSMKLTVLRHAR